MLYLSLVVLFRDADAELDWVGRDDSVDGRVIGQVDAARGQDGGDRLSLAGSDCRNCRQATRTAETGAGSRLGWIRCDCARCYPASTGGRATSVVEVTFPPAERPSGGVANKRFVALVDSVRGCCCQHLQGDALLGERAGVCCGLLLLPFDASLLGIILVGRGRRGERSVKSVSQRPNTMSPPITCQNVTTGALPSSGSFAGLDFLLLSPPEGGGFGGVTDGVAGESP